MHPCQYKCKTDSTSTCFVPAGSKAATPALVTKCHKRGKTHGPTDMYTARGTKKTKQILRIDVISLISQSLNLDGRRSTTDDVATIPSSAVFRESPNSIPVHALMLSSHLFFCHALLLTHCTVPRRIVFAIPEDLLEMWPYHLSFRFFTMVMRSSCTPITFWILLRISSFATWSL